MEVCNDALSRLDVDAGLAAAEMLCTGGDDTLSLEGPTFSAAKRSFRLKADLEEEAGAPGKGGRSGGGGNDGSSKAPSSASSGGSNGAAKAAGPVFCCADCC